jgi:ABC-type amino acid transport substrate-binding protein
MKNNLKAFGLALLVLYLCTVNSKCFAGNDLEAIKKAGVLRHLGVPYANFVTGSGDGLDVDIAKLFARHIGVKYEYVETNWSEVMEDLTGREIKVQNGQVSFGARKDIRGDIIANGFTILDWRKDVVDFSDPVFPTQVWLISRADNPLKPIIPSGDVFTDIAQVKSMMIGVRILGVTGTCLDPELYDIKGHGASVSLFSGNLNQIAPAVIKREADSALLDVPDALIALEKWPGMIKIIGPVSPLQQMGVAFRKDSPLLRAEFNRFLADIRSNGVYISLVKKYYPVVFDYYPDFFEAREAND